MRSVEFNLPQDRIEYDSGHNPRILFSKLRMVAAPGPCDASRAAATGRWDRREIRLDAEQRHTLPDATANQRRLHNAHAFV